MFKKKQQNKKQKQKKTKENKTKKKEKNRNISILSYINEYIFYCFKFLYS